MEVGNKDFVDINSKDDSPLSSKYGIKREHDSVDDFEHVDPEISSLKDDDVDELTVADKNDPLSEVFKVASLEKNVQPTKISEPAFFTSDLESGFLNRPKSEASSVQNVDFLNIEHNSPNPNTLDPLRKDTVGDFDYKPSSAIAKQDTMNFIEAETLNKTDNDLNVGSYKFDARDLFDRSSPNLLMTSNKILDNPGEISISRDNGVEFSKSELNETVDSNNEKDIYQDLIHASSKGSEKSSEIDLASLNSESKFKQPIDENKEINKSADIQEIDNYDLLKNKNIKMSAHSFDKIPHEICSSKSSTSTNVTKISETSSKQEEFLDPDTFLNETERTTASILEPVPVVDPMNFNQQLKPKEEKAVKISAINLDDIIGPEDVFKKIGLDAWFNPERLHPKVEALIYWRDPKKSGVVFGVILAILLSLAYFSFISVIAYVSLFTLFGTTVFRIYKSILQAVQKTSEGHPFKEFLELDLSLPQDKVRELTDFAVTHINAAVVELRRLFLVEDLVDSIKFGVLLWCLTFIGALFNGLTLIILAFVALFTIPKVYENNKASIDQYLEIGRSKIAEITSKVKAAVPIGKKEAEKAKEQ